MRAGLYQKMENKEMKRAIVPSERRRTEKRFLADVKEHRLNLYQIQYLRLGDGLRSVIDLCPMPFAPAVSVGGAWLRLYEPVLRLFQQGGGV